MAKILVTGADGMLGQDLCPILEKYNYNVIKTDIKTLDITDFDTAQTVINAHSPDMIIHCAAYTNVDKAEEDFETAKLINASGTENIAKICALKNIPILYISTDYVFDGKKQAPYKPDDNPNPINNYGLTKFYGEKAILKYCSKYFIVRTSWLYGIYGKNFVETMISLAAKPELKVVNDQTGCPTWTVELSNGIAKLLQNQNYGIYHICGSGKATWYEFAKEIFNLCNLKVNLIPCSSIEFPSPAKRPEYSVMDNSGLCENWKSSLKKYIEIRERTKNS